MVLVQSARSNQHKSIIKMQAWRCPNDPNILNCSCPLQRDETMIMGADATLYPKAGCFRMGKVLFNARVLYHSMGKHLWALLLHNPVGVSIRRVFHDGQLNMYCVSIHLTATRGGLAFLFEPFIGGTLMPSTCVRRIQRAMRRYLKRRRFEWRALAVMMATCPKLGEGSRLGQVIPEDVLWKQIVGTLILD